MERVESAAFGPTDRIGQLTMRNLDIADSRASSSSTRRSRWTRARSSSSTAPLRGAPGGRRRPDRQQPHPRGRQHRRGPGQCRHGGGHGLMARRSGTNDGRALGRPVRRRPVARAGGAVALDPLRLAADALRPGRLPRARQRACTPPACSTDDDHAELLRGLDALGRAVRRRRAAPGPGRRGRARRAGTAAARRGRRGASAAGCARAAAATTRSPPCSRRSCATTPTPSASLVLDLVEALADQAATTSTW